MAEHVRRVNKRLFEVRLFHHYWLDEGIAVFDHDSFFDQKKKDSRLQSYDVRSFVAITPTERTAKALKRFGCLYKESALGFLITTTNQFAISSDTIFEFIVTVKDPAFFNYTALTLRPQATYELYHQSEHKAYRYKENVVVCSNLTGASRGTALAKSLFLSKEIPGIAAGDLVESLILDSSDVYQLTSDQPGALQQKIDKAIDLPVFVHQDDVPVLMPPPGLAGVPERGIMLTDDIPDKLFALIRLSAVRNNDSDFSFIDGTGYAKSVPPIFQIHFKNRSTYWHYCDKNSQTSIDIELNPLPLTFFGNAGQKQKPSVDVVKAVMNDKQVTQLFSEIFV